MRRSPWPAERAWEWCRSFPFLVEATQAPVHPGPRLRPAGAGGSHPLLSVGVLGEGAWPALPALLRWGPVCRPLGQAGRWAAERRGGSRPGVQTVSRADGLFSPPRRREAILGQEDPLLPSLRKALLTFFKRKRHNHDLGEISSYRG